MDTDLVVRAQNGDEEAFASLAVAAGDRLHAVAHRILRDIDLAEDATQQALLTVWRDLPQLRDPARFDAWSYRLLVRACYAEARRTRRWAPNLRLLPADQPATDGRLGPGRRSRPARARVPAPFHRSSRGGGLAPLPRHAARRGRRDPRRPRRDGQIPSTSCDAWATCGTRCRLAADRAGGDSMSTDRDTTRIVRSWLEEGVTALPDRVLDAVLDQVPATSQRRPWWPARRFKEMNNVWKLAIAAAAVVVVAIVGINLLPRERRIVAGPVPSPTPIRLHHPTPTPSPSTASNLNYVGNFAPGTTYVMNDPCCTGPARGSASRCQALDGSRSIPVVLGKNAIGDPESYDIYLSPHRVGNLYTGGCNWRGTALDPPVGPTVDDLATALVAQAGPGASPPVPVTVGGHPGMKVELSISEGHRRGHMRLGWRLRASSAGGTAAGNPISAPPRGRTGTSSTTRSTSSTSTVRARSSTRCTCRARRLANLAELDQVVASIKFKSASQSPSGPSASTSP